MKANKGLWSLLLLVVLLTVVDLQAAGGAQTSTQTTGSCGATGTPDKSGCRWLGSGMGRICEYDIKQLDSAAKDHDAIRLSVRDQESILWCTSGKKFKVTRLVPEPQTCPDQPFNRRFPQDNPPGWGDRVHSTAPIPAAIHCKYKTEFELEDNTKYDPHIQVDR